MSTVSLQEVLNLSKRPILEQKYQLKQEVVCDSRNGEILKAYDQSEQVDLAVKQYKYIPFEDQDLKQLKLNELLALQQLQHPNIISLKDICVESLEKRYEQKYYLVFELYKEDLCQTLESRKYLEEWEVKIIMKQIMECLQYIHDEGYIHRDIKLENVLVSDIDTFDIKLIDFELTIQQDDWFQDEFFGTLLYMAPEIFDHRYNHKCDIWAAGVLMYLLLTGDFPYNPENHEDIYEEICNKKDQIYSHPRFQDLSDDTVHVLTKLLEFDIEERHSAEQVLNHQWFQ